MSNIKLCLKCETGTAEENEMYCQSCKHLFDQKLLQLSVDKDIPLQDLKEAYSRTVEQRKTYDNIMSIFGTSDSKEDKKYFKEGLNMIANVMNNIKDRLEVKKEPQQSEDDLDKVKLGAIGDVMSEKIGEITGKNIDLSGILPSVMDMVKNMDNKQKKGNSDSSSSSDEEWV